MEAPQLITFSQMTGAIGSLIWLWSEIERELTAAIRKMHGGEVPPSAHGISRSIEVWSQHVLRRSTDEELNHQLCRRLVGLLKSALATRNLVCHGLVGIRGQVSLTDEEAYLTVELDGDRRILPWSELQEMFAWMSRTKWLIRDLTETTVGDNSEGRQKSLVGWQDFSVQK